LCYSIESEEELEQLFNAGMNNGRDKEDKEEKEEAIQQDRKMKMKIKLVTLQKKR
jgi:hypothetical protein